MLLMPMMLVTWHSGNTLCRIDEVTLQQAWLVLGWVTVCGQVNHLCRSQPARSTQPSNPLCDGKLSTYCAGFLVILVL